MSADLELEDGTGTEVLDDATAELAGLAEGEAGATDPLLAAWAKPYMFWNDTANMLYKQLKADKSSWVKKGKLITDGTVMWEETAVTLASAATLNIGAAEGNVINVSGTTSITAFDTADAGIRRLLVFASALTIAHSASSIVLPGGDSITVAAGDVMSFVSQGSGIWKCVNYMPYAGIVSAYGLATTTYVDSASSGGINQWTKETTVVVGQIAYSANLPSWARLECVTAGTTASTEPTWGTTAGVLVTDGTATWIIDDVRDGGLTGDISYKMYLKTGHIKANGATVNRADYPRLLKLATDNSLFYDDGTRVFTGTTVASSTTISGISTANIAKLVVGMLISGTGITTGTTITAISTTSITISVVATAAGTVSISYGNSSNYPGLFGSGDGSTTFVLPDYRGLVIRGLDDSKGLDVDGINRIAGSYQEDTNKSHTHTGTAASAGAHTHSYTGPGGDSAGYTYGSPNNFGSATTGSSGAHTHTVSINATGSTETRMKNVALIAQIKY